MLRLILLAVVCCACSSKYEVWLDGYELGATITKRVGEFFSLEVKTKGDTGTWLPDLDMLIMDSDGNAIDHALMSWDDPDVGDAHLTELFLAKDLPAGAKLKLNWAGAETSYNIKSTPGSYMFSAPPEFIAIETMPVKRQWRLSYNTELQAGDIITWHIFSDHPRSDNDKRHTVNETTSTVLIDVNEEEATTDKTEEDSCRIFYAKITRAGQDISVNAAPASGSTSC